MLFPVLINVFYELLKITMIFITASFLGGVTDAAIVEGVAPAVVQSRLVRVMLGFIQRLILREADLKSSVMASLYCLRTV